MILWAVIWYLVVLAAYWRVLGVRVSLIDPRLLLFLLFSVGVFGRHLFFLSENVHRIKELMQVPYSGGSVNVSFMLICFCMLIFLMSDTRREINAERKHEDLRLRPVVVGLTLIGFLVGADRIFGHMSIGEVLLSAGVKRFQDLESGGTGSFGVERLLMMPISRCIVPAYCLTLGDGKLSRKQIVTIILLSLCATMPDILSGRRLTAGLMLFCPVYFIYSRNKSRLIPILSASAVMLIVGQMSLNRYSKNNSALIDESQVITLTMGNLNYMDFCTFHGIRESYNSTNFKFGTSFLNFIVAPIPRSLWPTKPKIDLGYEVSTVVFNRSGVRGQSIPPGILGELYMNFGLLGMFFGFFLLGRAVIGMYRRRCLKNRAVVNYLFFVLPFFIYLIEGDFSRGLIIFLAPMFVCSAFLKVK